MSYRLDVTISDQLKDYIDKCLEKYPFDYEGKISVLVRGSVIRELRRREVIR